MEHFGVQVWCLPESVENFLHAAESFVNEPWFRIDDQRQVHRTPP